MNLSDDDLNDSLDGLFGGPSGETVRAPKAPPASYVPAIERVFTEPCKKCGGSGQWRPGYPCFGCKGTGKLTFKTAPEQRAKAKVYSQKKVEQKFTERKNTREAWEAEHKAEMAWLRAAARRNDERGGTFTFPINMINAVNSYCTLTENQLAAVHKLMAKDAERTAARQAAKANAPVIDVSKIAQAFDRARSEAQKAGAEGVKWLRLNLDTFEFLDMPARGQLAAAIRVTENGVKLGRIEDGKFTRFPACTDEQLARILAAAADPLAAAKAFGLRFSSCSCCGRELTNPESIKLGIGPICAEKWFCA